MGHESRNSGPEDLSGDGWSRWLKMEAASQGTSGAGGEWIPINKTSVLFVHICEFLLYIFIHKNTF